MKDLFVTLSINNTRVNDTQHDIIMLCVSSIIVMLNAIMLSVMAPFSIQYFCSDICLRLLWRFCSFTKPCYAEYCHADCNYVELCHWATFSTQFLPCSKFFYLRDNFKLRLNIL
jgi:hypothetical protein